MLPLEVGGGLLGEGQGQLDGRVAEVGSAEGTEPADQVDDVHDLVEFEEGEVQRGDEGVEGREGRPEDGVGRGGQVRQDRTRRGGAI